MFGAIAGGIASALAGGAMSKLFGGGQKAASGGIQGDVLATDNNTVGMGDAGIKSAIQGSFQMAATETITSIILIKLIRVSLGTVRHPRRFKIVVIDIQITLKQMLRDFIGIRVNRAKKSGMVNITSSV